MKSFRRISALFLALLCILALPFTVFAEEWDDGSSDDGGASKVYSYVFDDETDDTAALHLHESYAENGNVDLYDAFRETALYDASLYISIGNVKFFLTAKTVQDTVKRGEPVMLYVKEIETDAEAEETASDSSGENASGEESEEKADVIYEMSLGGIPFEYGKLKVQIKHKTDNADAIRVVATDENGGETDLQSAYADNLVTFFPESNTFTVRITEEPVPEGRSTLLILLSGILALLILLSVVLIILLKTGWLKRRYCGDPSSSPDPKKARADEGELQ